MFGWRWALAQAAMILAGGLFLTAAAGLVAVAGWVQLAAMLGPAGASLSIAAGLALLALVLFALAARRPRRRRAVAQDGDAALRALFAEAGLRVPEPGERPPLMEAFLFGLSAALRLGRDSRR